MRFNCALFHGTHLLVTEYSNPNFVGRIKEKGIKLNEENDRAKEMRKETRSSETKILLNAKETKQAMISLKGMADNCLLYGRHIL